MAKIDAPEINVGEGGTSHVTQPIQNAPASAAPEQIQNLFDTGLDVFRSYKRDQARGASKSLLEEFTGFERKREIQAEETKVLEREKQLQQTMDNVKGGTPAFAMAAQEMAQVQRAKDELELKRDAVDQGLLSYEQYRRDAETLFYQQVALSPGLKDEIAQVMGEYLGIDPRGQTAAIAIEQKKAALKEGRDLLSNMRSGMQKLGLWDEWRTQEENMALYGTAYKKSARAMGDMDRQLKELQLAGQLRENQQEAVAREVNEAMIAAKPAAIRSLSYFGNLDAFKMTSREFAELDEETRLAWRTHLAQQRDALLSMGNTFKAKLGDKFDVEPHANDVVARFELLDSMISGKMKEEDIATRLAILNAEEDLVVGAEKLGMVLNNEQARRLTAIRELLGTETLAASAAASETIIELLEGRVQDLTQVPADKRADKIQAYNFALQNIAKGWSNRQDWDDNHVRESGNIVARISQHLTDEVPDTTRRHLLRLVANEDFMTRLAETAPRQHAMLVRNIVPHQQQLEANIAIKLTREAQQLRAQPGDFYLKKEDNRWMLLPTKELAAPITVRGAGPAGRSSEALNKAANEKRQQLIGNVTSSMNNARSASWTDLVRSRAVIMNISEAEAARQLSREMGISETESNVVELPGFAEETGAE